MCDCENKLILRGVLFSYKLKHLRSFFAHFLEKIIEFENILVTSMSFAEHDLARKTTGFYDY